MSVFVVLALALAVAAQEGAQCFGVNLLLAVVVPMNVVICGDCSDPCDEESAEDYDHSIHLAAVFIILVTSLLGTLIPIFTRRFAARASVLPLACGKLFGAGVILSTAFIHMFVPSTKVVFRYRERNIPESHK